MGLYRDHRLKGPGEHGPLEIWQGGASIGHQSFADLFEKLRLTEESVDLEAKRGERLGPSFLESVSAFANEPGRGGGYILMGVERKQDSLFPEMASDYEVEGVADPEQLQSDIASQCASLFSVAIRPVVTTELVEDKPVVLVFVPEADPQNKPVYIQSKGLQHGSYRRIGSTDQKCTEDDIALLHQQRDHRTFDQTVIRDASLEDLDPDAVTEYRRLRGKERATASELTYNDEELLYALHAVTRENGRVYPTVAGMMLFGKKSSLRRHFPMNRVDYVVVPGRDWVPDAQRRFATQEYLEPLIVLIPRIVSLVLGDIPKAFHLPRGQIQRQDQPLIPEVVIRESVVNALMHRNYSIRQPVQIIRYSNRIEIRNPGHSLVPDERLGEPGSLHRNEKIAAVLHDVGFAETKGSGIRTMIEAMNRANLSEPILESDRVGNRFAVTLFTHHLLGKEDVEWLSQFSDCSLSEDEAHILIVTRELGLVNNSIVRTLFKIDTLTASRRLQRLRNLGLLEQRGQGPNTIYYPGKRLSGESDPQTSALDEPPEPGSIVSLPVESGGLSVESGSLSVESGGLTGAHEPLPPELQDVVDSLGRRASPDQVKQAILNLCAWKPLEPNQIAHYIRRKPRHVAEFYVRALVREGRLAPQFPDKPNRPDQRYHITGK
ncbi:MAG: ATP-binding protein [Fimbriimonadaceae bacterium]|nr:MAG: ATP-binding protein [Fimbriimonadaceae bacterium]